MSLFLTLDQYNNVYIHEWLFYLPLIIFIFLIFEPPAVAGRVLWIRFRPSFRPFLLLSFHLFALPSFSAEAFWDWLIRFFFEARHGVRGPCRTVRDSRIFWKKYFCTKYGESGSEIGFFQFFGKFRYYFFSEFDLQRNFILFAVFLHKSLNQSNCRSFKSTISLE